MSISIGKYISQRLRSKGISNKDAALHVGLSKSAFEKILAQDDIYSSRLIKLSALLNENLFEYYAEQEPIKSLNSIQLAGWESQINSLQDKLADQSQIIENQKEVIKLLKEKEVFLTR